MKRAKHMDSESKKDITNAIEHYIAMVGSALVLVPGIIVIVMSIISFIEA